MEIILWELGQKEVSLWLKLLGSEKKQLYLKFSYRIEKYLFLFYI